MSEVAFSADGNAIILNGEVWPARWQHVLQVVNQDGVRGRARQLSSQEKDRFGGPPENPTTQSRRPAAQAGVAALRGDLAVSADAGTGRGDAGLSRQLPAGRRSEWRVLREVQGRTLVAALASSLPFQFCSLSPPSARRSNPPTPPLPPAISTTAARSASTTPPSPPKATKLQTADPGLPAALP